MISNKIFFLALLSLCMIFTSCEKEDIEVTTTEEDENPTVVINCDDFAVTLTEIDGTISTVVSGGDGVYTYAWSTSEIVNSIDVEESGTYTVTVTDSQECTTSASLDVTLVSISCNNTLNVEAPDFGNPLSFLEDAEGYLWKESCNNNYGLTYNYNYLITDVNWDIYDIGLDEPNPLLIHDGMPAICFGSDALPQAGDVVSSYIPEALLRTASDIMTGYNLDNVTITINSASEEEGGEISGEISGTLLTQEGDESSTVSGSFCVKLAAVCGD